METLDVVVWLIWSPGLLAEGGTAPYGLLQGGGYREENLPQPGWHLYF